jgi:predicted nucleic-acid-binding Zn-ribbon protein
MNENKAKKCPKCGSPLEEGSLSHGGKTLLPSFTVLKKGDLLGDVIALFYCPDCGYIELYNEKIMKTKGIKP